MEQICKELTNTRLIEEYRILQYQVYKIVRNALVEQGYILAVLSVDIHSLMVLDENVDMTLTVNGSKYGVRMTEDMVVVYIKEMK